MVDVFISYSREDVDKVGLLARKIEEEGYDVWWDADLPPHLSYGDVITTKIGMAKAAIVVWSTTSAASEWVRAEADMARNQKKLVQTSLDNVMPPLPFNQIQYAEIGNWDGNANHTGWTKVKASLSDLCGPPKKAAATATPTPMPAAAVPAAPMPAPAPAANPEAISGAIPSVPGRTVPKGMLYAGIGVFAVVLALGAGMMLGGGGGDSDASEETPAALSGPLAPTTAPGSVPAIAPEGAAPAAAPAGADELDRHVIVMNASSQPLRELYASPVTSDNWEEDLLGTRVLGAGESISANIDNGTTECLFDMKAVMADDKEYIQQRVNVCEVSQWSIGDGGDSVR